MNKEYHPIANIFPLMTGEEYEALKADIQVNGLREPIWLHEDGRIIDGRNRYRACMAVGAEAKFRTWEGDGSLVTFVVSLNLHRRHLTSSQRGALAVDILPMLEAEAKERKAEAGRSAAPGKPAEKDVQIIAHLSPLAFDDTGRARAQAAAILNTNRQYVSDAKRIAEEAPEVFEMVREGAVNMPAAKQLAALQDTERAAVLEEMKEKGLSEIGSREVKNATKTIRRKHKEEKKKEIPDIRPVLDVGIDLYVSSIADLHNQVPAESIDYIITDPPYPKEYLHLYSELSQFARHALKEGGSLLVMVGQSYLPEIINRLSEEMEYHWTMSYLTPGGQSAQLWQRNINTFWKPVLWFVKGKYTSDWAGDVVTSNKNDKHFHEWGQSESGMKAIIERFTYPDNIICDPFLGGGTTGVVAVSMNRRFVGADIDAECVEISKARIAEVIHGK